MIGWNVHVVVFCNDKEKQHLQGKGKEKKNVCNEKWKRKLFAMKMKRKKCERTKCLQWKGKEEIVHIERGDNKMFKMKRERIKSHKKR